MTPTTKPGEADLTAAVERLMSIGCESAVAEGRYKGEWLAAVERARELLAALGTAPATPVPASEPVAKVLKDLRWRLDDICDMLMKEGFNGQRIYGCDEWSTPTVNLATAIAVIDKALAAPTAPATQADAADAAVVRALRQIIDADDAGCLTQQLIEIGRAALCPRVAALADSSMGGGER